MRQKWEKRDHCAHTPSPNSQPCYSSAFNPNYITEPSSSPLFYRWDDTQDNGGKETSVFQNKVSELSWTISSKKASAIFSILSSPPSRLLGLVSYRKYCSLKPRKTTSVCVLLRRSNLILLVLCDIQKHQQRLFCNCIHFQAVLHVHRLPWDLCKNDRFSDDKTTQGHAWKTRN